MRCAGVPPERVTSTAAGQDTRAERIFDAVQPDETPERPAVSHVIGVSTGLLDTWFIDPALQRSLDRTRIPQANKQVRAAATDLLALARKHRAFDSIRSLILRYAGKVLMDASGLAVAAAITAIAGSGENVADVCRRLLLDDEYTPVIPEALQFTVVFGVLSAMSEVSD